MNTSKIFEKQIVYFIFFSVVKKKITKMEESFDKFKLLKFKNKYF